MERLDRLLAAEDARGTGPDGTGPLLEGLTDRDAVMRRLAVRGLGRFETPSFAPHILPLLADAVPRVRAEAAQAAAQSVQAVARALPAGDARRAMVDQVCRALEDRLAVERDPSVIDALLRSLGRLPYATDSAARDAERVMLAHAASGESFGMVHGLYSLALARRATGTPSPAALDVLRRAVRAAPALNTRRMAVLALNAANAFDSVTAFLAIRDDDEQLRRIAVAGATVLPHDAREDRIRRALADRSAMVRLEAIRTAEASVDPRDCAPIAAATHDANPHVVLAAIDALGWLASHDRRDMPGSPSPPRTPRCTDPNAALNVLLPFVFPDGKDIIATRAPLAAWRTAAHALVAIARCHAPSAERALPAFAHHNNWMWRVYAVRAMQLMGHDPAIMLPRETNDNVREAIVDALAPTVRHQPNPGAGSQAIILALTSPGYQVVRAAAAALKEAPRPEALPPLFDALDRLTREGRETSRDPRMEILERIDELGSPADSLRLRSYLSDFDTTVARRSAELLTRWTGTTVHATPRPLPIHPEPLAEFVRTPDLQLRVTMAHASGGGTFLVRLYSDDAPATVARIVRLAHAHYYDGLPVHRVVPNFVIQGGSPGASEYIGDGPFMRDELGARSHARGTLGLSTRGRDTGDAQWFVNLVDNPRLDHAYTVFGEIVAGRAVAERILEGDVVARVTPYTTARPHTLPRPPTPGSPPASFPPATSRTAP